MFIFEFDHLDWLSQFHREWRQTSKLFNFQDFSDGPSIRFKIWKWLKLLNSVPFIKKPLVNENYSIFKISPMIRVYDSKFEND